VNLVRVDTGFLREFERRRVEAFREESESGPLRLSEDLLPLLVGEFDLLEVLATGMAVHHQTVRLEELEFHAVGAHPERRVEHFQRFIGGSFMGRGDFRENETGLSRADLARSDTDRGGFHGASESLAVRLSSAHLGSSPVHAIVVAKFLSEIGTLRYDPKGENLANIMNQLSLLETPDADLVLADDERGQITYSPRFLLETDARELFAEVRADAEWDAQRRRMYDRDVDVPRLTSGYRIEGEEKPMPPRLRAVAEMVTRTLRVPFTNLGLNLYRTGQDSVAPHNDHLDELEQGWPIVLLSLGATRRMTVRAKQPPKRVIHQDLAAGSLFVMSYDTQIHYTHGIPKTEEIVGERISLAFRVRPVEKASMRYWVGTRTSVRLTPDRSAISVSRRSSDLPSTPWATSTR
jgi:alkylated DNA repair dioxygenase AlkB